MKNKLFSIVALMIVLSMILVACGATPEPTQAPEPTKAPEATKAPEPTEEAKPPRGGLCLRTRWRPGKSHRR